MESPAESSLEKVRIAWIFKKHVEAAIAELGTGYTVDLKGDFKSLPITIVVQVKSKDKTP